MKRTAALLLILAACAGPTTDPKGEELRNVRCQGEAHGAAVVYELHVHTMLSWAWAIIGQPGQPPIADTQSTTEAERPDRWCKDGWCIYTHDDPLRISVDEPGGRREFIRTCLEL